ncbi:MAG: universal stress protein [Parvularculaceae bacterium]
MTIKTVLTPILTESSVSCGLETAFALGEAFESHIVGFHLRRTPDVSALYGYYAQAPAYLAENIDAYKEASNKRAKDLRAMFDDACAKRGAPVILPSDHKDAGKMTVSWRDEEGPWPSDLALAGRVADITVLPAFEGDAPPSYSEVLETMLFESGRPALIAGEGDLTKAPKTIAIGWNGGLEASRAMKAAMPFVKRAHRVIVLSVDEGGWRGPDSEEAVSYLKMHGVNAIADHVSRVDDSTGKVLLAAARERDADLLVAGAYSHNRLREMILGGVTRDLSRQTELPVLLAH